MLERLKEIGAAVFSVVLVLFVAWWLWEVAQRLGTAPLVNDRGAVVLDEFQRAKDILLIVFPLLTAAGGYWFGNKGAETAKEEARESKKDAKEAQGKLETLIEVSDKDLVEQARRVNPALWV